MQDLAKLDLDPNLPWAQVKFLKKDLKKKLKKLEITRLEKFE